MTYHGPKFNCFERLPDEQLMKYFHFYAPMFRNLTNAGIDKADAYAFSRNYKFEVPRFPSAYSMEVYQTALEMGSGIIDDQFSNLLGTLDVPVDRLFEFVSENKEVLKKGQSISIWIDLLKYLNV